MEWIKYVAKALVAVASVVLTGVAANEINLPPEAVIALQAVVAGAGVFGVRNGPHPE